MRSRNFVITSASGSTPSALDGFARRFAARVEGVEPDADVMTKFRERMDDDLDTGAAIALLHDAERRANREADVAAAAAAFEIARALGLELRSEVGDVSDEALQLAAERDDARAAKDWARADALRDQLDGMGYEVTDTPEGTHLRPR